MPQHDPPNDLRPGRVRYAKLLELMAEDEAEFEAMTPEEQAAEIARQEFVGGELDKLLGRRS